MKKKQLQTLLRETIEKALKFFDQPTKEDIAQLFKEQHPKITETRDL